MMTTVRKLAIAISKWVCRNAPAGAQAWGTASERELEHIASDWEALRWAVGSTTVLLAGSRSAPPIASAQQVPALARCMARIVWRRTLLCVAIVAFQAYWWTTHFQNMHGWALRTGCYLIVVAVALVTVQAYLRRWQEMPRGIGNEALIAPLRAELVRQRQFHSGGWLAARLYSLMPGLTLLCCGYWAASDRSGEDAMLALGIASFFAVAMTFGTRMQLRTAEAFQRQIDALDALGVGSNG